MGKKLQQSNKKKTIITVVALVVVMLFGLWLVGRYQVRQDAARFHDADQKKQQVFDDLVNKLGTPTRVANSNICYNSEQQPYSNGTLWCQVASAAYFSTKTRDSINDLFNEVAQANGLKKTDMQTGDLEFEGAANLLCEVAFDVSKFAGEPAYEFPRDSSTQQLLIVRCADRAKAEHYNYVDY